MQTDLKMQNEINSEHGLNLFWDGGLWCSAKLTVSLKRLLWSFNNTVLGGRASPLFEKKLRNTHFQIKRIFDGIRIVVWRTSPKHPNLWLVRFDPISSEVSLKTTIFTKLHLVGVDFCVQPGDIVYAQKMECFSYQGS